MANMHAPVYNELSSFCRQTGLYESLRPEQETVVREFFLSGKDVFAALLIRATANRCDTLVCHTLLT